MNLKLEHLVVRQIQNYIYTHLVQFIHAKTIYITHPLDEFMFILFFFYNFISKLCIYLSLFLFIIKSILYMGFVLFISNMYFYTRLGNQCNFYFSFNEWSDTAKKETTAPRKNKLDEIKKKTTKLTHISSLVTILSRTYSVLLFSSRTKFKINEGKMNMFLFHVSNYKFGSKEIIVFSKDWWFEFEENSRKHCQRHK